MAAFADDDDMVDRFDERTLKDLVSDTGTPATTLAGNDAIDTALDDATGEIKAALRTGDLYDPDDLAALTGESLSYLKQITCQIALINLLQRRPEKFGKQLAELRDIKEKVLDQFRQGHRVFGIDGVIAAGLPTVDGPTSVDYQRLNLLPERTRNFYPHRQSRLPIGR